MTPEQAAAFADCLELGGVVVFPADTVYGLACDPAADAAVERLYALKGRARDKPAAVMFFDLDAALAVLRPEPRTEDALRALLPGPLTVLLSNADRKLNQPDPMGVRVPDIGGPADRVVLQSSANRAGGPDPVRFKDVDPALIEGADLAIDAGPLPGIASTVVDLRDYETSGAWRIVREGAATRESLERALSSEGT